MLRRSNMFLIVTAILAAFAISAQAQTVTITFSDTISADDPVFNTVVGGSEGGCSDISGRAANYKTHTFQVEQAGVFNISVAAAAPTRVYIYSPSFDPGNPFANCITFAGSGLGSIDRTLQPSVNYVAVVIQSGSFSSYTLQIAGENIIPTSPTVEAVVTGDFVFTDGRINLRDSAAPIVVYATDGNTGMNIYSAAGAFLLRVTPAEIVAVPTNPAGNAIIASNSAAGLFVARLADGTFQVQAPQYNGKTYFLFFDVINVTGAYSSTETQ